MVDIEGKAINNKDKMDFSIVFPVHILLIFRFSLVQDKSERLAALTAIRLQIYGKQSPSQGPT